MANQEDLRKSVLAAAQGAMSLNIAFIGVSGGLFEALANAPGTASEVAARASADEGYVRRWCDAAYAFGLLDCQGDAFSLTELGHAFRPSAPDTLMPFAVGAVLGAHMSERAATLLKTGERPGEKVLAERESILPWFGPMLEANFGVLFERQVLPALDVYRALDEKGGVAVDLGCGNGWYLRKLAQRYPHVRCVGLDGFDENIRHATEAAEKAGLADRVTFRAGDIHHYTLPDKVNVLAMNRALHHVWDRKDEVFAKMRDALVPGGSAVIWEPRWPDERSSLRDPRRRPMAFQNLNEHVQGNHFLRPDEIEAAMRGAGLTPQTFLFAEGAEAVVVGTRS